MAELPQPFDAWAIVEIYGHQRYAGRVSEQQIGGCNFVRVDIPATTDQKPFTKLFGQGAIFSITPVEESIARAAAEHCSEEPVRVYELPDEVQRAMNHIQRERRLPLHNEIDSNVVDF